LSGDGSKKDEEVGSSVKYPHQNGTERNFAPWPCCFSTFYKKITLTELTYLSKN
jgi:hypothetical protein